MTTSSSNDFNSLSPSTTRDKWLSRIHQWAVWTSITVGILFLLYRGECFGSLKAEPQNTTAFASDSAYLLDFTADYCQPCKAMAPTLAKLEARGTEVRRVDITKQEQIARQYRVTSIPTLIWISDRKEVKRWVGLTSYETLSGAIGFTPPVLAQPSQKLPPEGAPWNGRIGPVVNNVEVGPRITSLSNYSINKHAPPPNNRAILLITAYDAPKRDQKGVYTEWARQNCVVVRQWRGGLTYLLCNAHLRPTDDVRVAWPNQPNQWKASLVYRDEDTDLALYTALIPEFKMPPAVLANNYPSKGEEMETVGVPWNKPATHLYHQMQRSLGITQLATHGIGIFDRPVIDGESGSPVYRDGKLVAIISTGWFSSEENYQAKKFDLGAGVPVEVIRDFLDKHLPIE